jgi:hypothetical protein
VVTSAADFGAMGGDEGDAGDDAMGAAGEETQHAGGVGGVFGLAEDVVVEGDGGVGAEHLRAADGACGAPRGSWLPTLSPERRRKGGGTDEFVVDGLGFFAGEAGDVGDGVFVGVGVFGDVGGVDLEGEAGLGEEFAAAGRG